MSPEDFACFEELGHMYSDSYRIEFFENFRYGFSLAVSLGAVGLYAERSKHIWFCHVRTGYLGTCCV